MSGARVDPATLSDLVVYADESGDHGLNHIDENFSVFVLAFIIMKREDYITGITPALQRLKFRYWGHDQIVFHEREVRKKIGPFAILTDQTTHQNFMDELTILIKEAPFRLCVAVIDKLRLKEKYSNP